MLDHDIPANIREWVSQQIGRVDSAAKLPGSTSTTLYRIQAGAAGYVLRIFDNAGWLANEPDLAPHEAAALQKAANLEGAATPQLVAFDDGEVCSMPVLLMTLLPGEVMLIPVSMEDWLRSVAQVLAAVHEITVPDFGWQYRRWFQLAHFRPPRWSQHPDLWRSAYDILVQNPPETPVRFIHRDYHPTNLLWQGGRISGVVDWINACSGPVSVDVTHCRNNLVCMYGIDIADRFRQYYEDFSGWEHHPYWDLVGIFESFYGDMPENPPSVYTPWLEFGLTGLTDTLMRERADAWLVAVMQQFS